MERYAGPSSSDLLARMAAHSLLVGNPDGNSGGGPCCCGSVQGRSRRYRYCCSGRRVAGAALLTSVGLCAAPHRKVHHQPVVNGAYDAATRVPCTIVLPLDLKPIPPQAVRDVGLARVHDGIARLRLTSTRRHTQTKITSHMDIMPTLLDLLETEPEVHPHEYSDGRSLMRYAEDPVLYDHPVIFTGSMHDCMGIMITENLVRRCSVLCHHLPLTVAWAPTRRNSSMCCACASPIPRRPSAPSLPRRRARSQIRSSASSCCMSWTRV